MLLNINIGKYLLKKTIAAKSEKLVLPQFCLYDISLIFNMHINLRHLNPLKNFHNIQEYKVVSLNTLFKVQLIILKANISNNRYCLICVLILYSFVLIPLDLEYTIMYILFNLLL